METPRGAAPSRILASGWGAPPGRAYAGGLHDRQGSSHLQDRRRLCPRGRRRAARACRGCGRPATPVPRPAAAARPPRRRPGGAHDARGEGLAAREHHPGDPAAGRPRVQPLVRGAARGREPGDRDRLPAVDRPGRDLRPARGARDGRGDRPRGAGQAQPGREGGPGRPAVPGPDLLLAEHQHLPRSALGARPGDLRGGPVPDRQAGCRLHQRAAGERRQAPLRDRDRQALRRPQRPGAAAPRLRRDRVGSRPGGHLPAGLPRGGRRRQGALGDVRLQRGERRSRLRQRAPARRDAAAAVGVPGLRHRRLRRRARHRDRPPLRPLAGRGRGPGHPRRHRQRLHGQLRPQHRAAGVPEVRRRHEAGPAAGGGGGRGAETHAAHALRAGALRPPGQRGRGGDARLGAGQPRAPRAGAAPGARVDGAAEERRHAAAGGPAGEDRRRRSARRLGAGPARQLQRRAVPLDDGARRDPEALPAGAGHVRVRHHLPPADRARAGSGAGDAGGQARPEGRGVLLAGAVRRAGRGADGSAGRLRRGSPWLGPSTREAGPADALDGLPDAGRVGHLPDRRRGLGQPPAPGRQVAGRHHGWLAAGAEHDRDRAREGPPLRGPGRGTVDLHPGSASHLAGAGAGRSREGRGGGAGRGRRDRRRRHHLRPRGRGVERRPARLQGRRPHQPRPAARGGGAAPGRDRRRASRSWSC